MNKLLPISLIALVMTLSGCAWVKRHTPWHHDSGSTAAPTQTTHKPPQTHVIVTPDESLTAKVVSVNTVGRFVVLNFPDGRMPKMDQHLFLYRGGLMRAEVKIVGPQQDFNIVADLLSGDAQTGDSVRDQ